MLRKSFFLHPIYYLKVISKNYNLLVEVPFYTEDMVSKYLNYFDSLNAGGATRGPADLPDSQNALLIYFDSPP